MQVVIHCGSFSNKRYEKNMTENANSNCNGTVQHNPATPPAKVESGIPAPGKYYILYIIIFTDHVYSTGKLK